MKDNESLGFMDFAEHGWHILIAVIFSPLLLVAFGIPWLVGRVAHRLGFKAIKERDEDYGW